MTRSRDDAIGEVPVRLHHWYGVCRGLFRPLAKSGGPRPALNVVHELAVDELGGERLTLRLEAREALGAGEQTTMLALLAIADRCLRSKSGVARLNAEAVDRVGQHLWSGLGATGDEAFAGETLRFSTSWRAICQASGAAGGGSEVLVRQEHLRRLCNVQVWEYVGTQRAPRRQSKLLSWILADDERVHVALDHRLVGALLGTPYAQVSMSERLTLRSDTARVLHAALSALVRPGQKLQVHLETLCSRLWPDWIDDINGATRRRRRLDVEKALGAIDRLPHWRVLRRPGAPLLVHRTRSGTGVRVRTQDCQIVFAPASEEERDETEISNRDNELTPGRQGGLFIPLA